MKVLHSFPIVFLLVRCCCFASLPDLEQLWQFPVPTYVSRSVANATDFSDKSPPQAPKCHQLALGQLVHPRSAVPAIEQQCPAVLQRLRTTGGFKSHGEGVGTRL